MCRRNIFYVIMFEICYFYNSKIIKISVKGSSDDEKKTFDLSTAIVSFFSTFEDTKFFFTIADDSGFSKNFLFDDFRTEQDHDVIFEISVFIEFFEKKRKNNIKTFRHGRGKRHEHRHRDGEMRTMR